jgi:predicted DsbA family dithiol-disulfide isomerase
LVFEGYQFAKEHGKGNEFFHRVFTAFFQEELNIEDVEILTKLAGEVGLSMESFREALVSRTYGKLHQEVLRHAYERAQITAVPTLIIGDTVIQGLASKERLAQAIDQEAAKAKHNRFDGMQCGIDGNC